MVILLKGAVEFLKDTIFICGITTTDIIIWVIGLKKQQKTQENKIPAKKFANPSEDAAEGDPL